MVVFITGGSGSGKSAFGEEIAVKLNNSDLIYLATMKPYGKEGLDRVRKHKLQREGKGFHTLEIYEDLASLSFHSRPTVLLECMSNLLANEMFKETTSEQLPGEDITGTILAGISHLIQISENVVIISNEVFSEGDSAYESTRDYVKCLGFLNQKLSGLSEVVCEVVYGIPVFYKGSQDWRVL